MKEERGEGTTVPGSCWLRGGGVLNRRCGGKSIVAVVDMVRSCARSLAMLVCFDGLASYVTVFVQGFRHKQPRNGCAGRPRLLVEPGLLFGQVIKHSGGRRRVALKRPAARGSAEVITVVPAQTDTGTGGNTASIERFSATFCGP
jgi:hypothetical protein